MPWFDFVLRSTDLMTHLSVFDGFTNPEVIQDRPTCETPCHPSECAATCGENASAPETCYSTTPSLDCSTEQETGHLTDLDRVCCDGLERHLAIDEVMAADWVSLADASLLTEACAAFPASSGSCASFSTRKGQVQSCDSTTKLCAVWVPAAQTSDSPAASTPPADAVLSLPIYGLVAKADLQMKSIVVPDPTYRDLWDTAWSGSTFRVDFHTGLVVNADAQTAIDYEIFQGWFITMIRYDPGYWYGSRWFRYSATIRDQLRRSGKGDVSIYVTDEEIFPKPECGLSYYPDPFDTVPGRSGQVWMDNKGNNCTIYEERNYCTLHAEPTTAWCDDIFYPNTVTTCDSNTDMINNACPDFSCVGESDGLPISSYAVFECCQCGGGDSNAPDGWVEPMTKKLVFQ